MTHRSRQIGFVALLALGCSSSEAAKGRSAAPDASTARDSGPDNGAPAWEPGQTLSSLRATERGMVDLRGLIHEHSVYSHDACDNAPRDPVTDAIDEQCFQDFRDGLCRAAHDFVFLTDHPDSFARTEFPDVLQYRSDRGDQLVERNGAGVANRAACPDGSTTLVVAGTESSQGGSPDDGAMPVGLEHHVAATPDARSALYGKHTTESTDAFRSAGAVVLVAHTEDYTADQLVALSLDGFEMYNLHANFTAKLSTAVPLLAELSQPDKIMQSDLVLLPILFEDPAYRDTWGTVLARGARRTTTMGTDAHRNSLNVKMPDGDRVDSWGRMNRWFSNHLLVRRSADGSWDDRELKDALRAGRLYGAFEVFGYPAGFDFHAEDSTGAIEMGGETKISASPTLVVATPSLRRPDPNATAPDIRTIIWRAIEGGWEQVAEGTGKIRHVPDQPGAYRAEVRIVPRHLTAYLKAHADLAEVDSPWIYSNAIYVAN